MTTHTIDREEVMAWLDGELEPARKSVVEAHVNTCEECRTLASEFRQVSERLSTWQIADAPTFAQSASAGQARVEQIRSTSTDAGMSRSWWRARGPFSLPRWAVGCALGILAVIVVTTAQFTRTMHFAQPAEIEAPTVANQPTTTAYPLQERAGPPRPLTLLREGQGEGQRGQSQQRQTGRPSEPVLMGVQVGQPASDRMIVRTASITLTSDRFDQIRESLEKLVAAHQGRITAMNATGDPSSRRSLRATVGVPAARLDALLAGLRGLGRVQDESLGGDDVTESFRDLGLRTANARREETRLVELLSRRTGDLADVLAVEREVARVRLEIERMEAETRATQQRVDLATVTLTVQEQYRADLALGPLPLPTRFKNALVDGSRRAAESLVGAVLLVLQIAPTLIVWVLILAWPARWAWRRLLGNPAT
jgi:hypothetical protein